MHPYWGPGGQPRNWTGDPLVYRPAFNTLSHSSQGWIKCFAPYKYSENESWTQINSTPVTAISTTSSNWGERTLPQHCQGLGYKVIALGQTLPLLNYQQLAQCLAKSKQSNICWMNLLWLCNRRPNWYLTILNNSTFPFFQNLILHLNIFSLLMYLSYKLILSQ